MAIRIERLSGACGAVLHGIDLRRVDDGGVAAIRAALLDHAVVFFREQELSPEAFIAVARRFGTPVEYPFVRGIPGYPEIIEVAKLEHEKMNFGGVWHSDTAYLEEPPMGTMLLARELPPHGGDTLFSNMYVAWETLSDGMKRMLDGLRAVNNSAVGTATRTREDGGRQVFEAVHPVARTHPENGRRTLYVNPGHTLRFEDMTEEESRPILEMLFRHQVRPELTCRFRWENGSLAFWDNRAAQHNPVNDYHGHRRIMHRITLKGDRPG